MFIIMKIHHIAISVKDLKRSVNFYKENFGFEEVSTFTKPDWDGSAVNLRLGDTQMEIFGFDGAVDKKDDLSDFKVIGLKHIAIQVDSVNEKYEELKKKGIDIDKPKKGTTCALFCFMKDPDGIPIELYEAN